MQTATEVHIRSLLDDDFAAMARIFSAINPDAPTTADEMRRDVQRVDRTKMVSEWLVAEDPSGIVVAYAGYRHTPWSFHPDKYRVHGGVHPDWQGHGVGRRLMDLVLDALRSRGARRIKASAREDRARSTAFLQRYGFVEHARDFESRLPVASCDLSRFPGYAEQAANAGVVITTLEEELRRDPDCLRAVYQAHGVLDIGAPRDDPETPTPPPLAQFLADEVHHPRALLDAFFLAKHGDFYVGESALKRSDAMPDVLQQQLTGVVPEFRGKGIATALKLRTVEYAQRHGYREIRTWNSSRNGPMLAINGKLEFVHQPAWIAFQLNL